MIGGIRLLMFFWILEKISLSFIICDEERMFDVQGSIAQW